MVISCILSLSGCGTILSVTANDYTPYAGVSRDFSLIQEGGIMSVLAVVDLPLSLVFDTLFLPVTLSQK
ncbi:YceK/YidQ family lipoprotein [Otariodibacter sp.]|uniref:YceK/YidQ family lipoprotein n=1 Tax=Otariodibacter sp. TaxID=3030919 RepID=UPI00261F011B|nr:YceK/YidQ family lipoprotein [Otariodibacter sp.]